MTQRAKDLDHVLLSDGGNTIGHDSNHDHSGWHQTELYIAGNDSELGEHVANGQDGRAGRTWPPVTSPRPGSIRRARARGMAEGQVLGLGNARLTYGGEVHVVLVPARPVCV